MRPNESPLYIIVNTYCYYFHYCYFSVKFYSLQANTHWPSLHISWANGHILLTFRALPIGFENFAFWSYKCPQIGQFKTKTCLVVPDEPVGWSALTIFWNWFWFENFSKFENSSSRNDKILKSSARHFKEFHHALAGSTATWRYW